MLFRSIDWWQLEASTYSGVSAANPITGTRWMNVTPNVTIGGNAAVFSVYSFAWFIKTNTLAQTINKWIPAGGPNQLRYAYSLHVKDNSLLSIDENEQDSGLTIFPNPTEDVVNLTFVSSGNESKLEIYDAQGKIVASPNLGYKEFGEHTVSINVGNLSDGLYLIKISSGGSTVSKKFIKR